MYVVDLIGGEVVDKKVIKNCVKTAIENVIKEGTTDVAIFNRPFELKEIAKKENKNFLIEEISNIINKIINNGGNFEELKFKKNGYIFVPKKDFYDFRKCALIDIIDEVKYLSLVLLIVKEIEKNRVSKKNVFSYRYKISGGRLFDKQYNFTSFKHKCVEKKSLKKNKIVIECDVANFYDRLNLHRLKSVLLSLNGIDLKAVDMIDELLLFWANRDSYGIPVGSNASRILAEASLIETDRCLMNNNIDFCRFVDDYRIYTDNIANAHSYLAVLLEKLNKDGLSINLAKTKTKDISNFFGKKKEIKQKNDTDPMAIAEIIRGYSGLIPTKFRRLSDSEKSKLKKENEQELLEKLKTDLIIKEEDIVRVIKIIISKEKYELLDEMPKILEKYPQFIPYFADAVEKNSNNFTQELNNKITKTVSYWLKKENMPEYIYISLIKLFDCSNEEYKRILFNYFKNLKRNSGAYIGRALLEKLDGFLNRQELLEIRDYYLRSDIWEKRQIIKMLQKTLSPEENRPFFKDVLMNNDDYIIKFLIGKKKGRK